MRLVQTTMINVRFARLCRLKSDIPNRPSALGLKVGATNDTATRYICVIKAALNDPRFGL